MKLPLDLTRIADRTRSAEAGCHVCHASVPRWTGANAQAVAARHHDRTGHATWYRVVLAGTYGRAAPDSRQIDIEDAIASASSGDRPETAPLPDLDAPAVTAAGVSAPKAAQSKRALAAAMPEHLYV